MRERDKMTRGLDYHINDDELREIRFRTRDKVDEFNALSARQATEKEALIRTLFRAVGSNVHFEKGMRIDYGINTTIGNNVFINFNFVLLDCAPVTIGNNVFIGPEVQIYTAQHPLDIELRREHIGSAQPVSIGHDVWIGGGCVILPGVTLGDGCTVGAGSVVTRSVPAGAVACGNPCRVIRYNVQDN